MHHKISAKIVLKVLFKFKQIDIGDTTSKNMQICPFALQNKTESQN